MGTENKKVHIRVVSLAEPCTACIIIDNAVREVLAKVQAEYGGIDVEIIILDSLKNMHEVNGLEVEKFPAILINDEQVTAGTILSKRQLLKMIDEIV